MWATADAEKGAALEPPSSVSKEVSVYWMDGWSWVWMAFMMGFWLIVLGAVVYVAVRLGQRPPRKPH
jgi:heme/copper-type cytochrome/quinol oxidase subunit 2